MISIQTPALSTRQSGADEINRLHAEVEKLSGESRTLLDAAVVAAWQAGQLLVVEKRHVRRIMGPGAWQLWLAQHFSGTARTAQRYMLLAKNFSDATFLHRISLRQAYFRLGIATEPKSAGQTIPIPQLPRHAALATRLLGVLKTQPNLLPLELQKAYQQDLRPLYERLRALFEPGFR